MRQNQEYRRIRTKRYRESNIYISFRKAGYVMLTNKQNFMRCTVFPLLLEKLFAQSSAYNRVARLFAQLL